MASETDPLVREETCCLQGTSTVLVFSWNGESVPATFLLPHMTGRPVPAVLLLHGFNLRKEHMAETMGNELLSRGMASLAFDLPFHGERYTGYFAPPKNPLKLMNRWRAVQRECQRALGFLAGHQQIDRKKLGLAGFSLGAFLGLKMAVDAAQIRALVLAAVGDLPNYVPFVDMIRKVANPLQWAGLRAGRPLLMMHGRQDSIISPDLAERLFNAACEPKEILWFDSGHVLPPEAMKKAAAWLGRALEV
jgi:hypothetical protein